MMLAEQVFAQAQVLAGTLDSRQHDLLRVLCYGTTASLAHRLKDGLKPEDCKADFLAAASLFALASLSTAGEKDDVEQLSVGDMTLRRRSSDAASNCLRNQAELIIAPYLQDGFSFLGV